MVNDIPSSLVLSIYFTLICFCAGVAGARGQQFSYREGASRGCRSVNKEFWFVHYLGTQEKIIEGSGRGGGRQGKRWETQPSVREYFPKVISVSSSS